VTRWSILIPTLGERGPLLARLLATLLPQVDAAGGQVRIVALWNNGERPLAHVRQDLIDHADSDYVTFIDDDDLVPDYYVSRVLPLLDGVDQVGWRMQQFWDGAELKPTFHSLRYGRWFEDARGYYRDVTHLNPVRTELARKADFRVTLPPEDSAWVDQLRPHVKTEHYIEDCMYYYHFTEAGSRWTPGSVIRHHVTYAKPVIDNANFTWHPGSS
jgi:glycosyltransferase involved in cell wall biosynthesis